MKLHLIEVEGNESTEARKFFSVIAEDGTLTFKDILQQIENHLQPDSISVSGITSWYKESCFTKSGLEVSVVELYTEVPSEFRFELTQWPLNGKEASEKTLRKWVRKLVDNAGVRGRHIE